MNQNSLELIFGARMKFMHLQFIHWYGDYCLKKGLSPRQFQDLKEAITFILNEKEFSNIISFKDVGYYTHRALRMRLKGLWRGSKNFKSFLNASIYLTKELMK